MKIQLRKYQQLAVDFAEKVDYCLYCMRVGSGKTICAMFALRNFFKKKLVDKAIIACTKSSVAVFKEDFKDKANMDINLIESPEALIDFLKSNEKACLIKYSMFEKAGGDEIILNKLKQFYDENLKVALVIDEAHKMQNPEGVAHEGFQRFMGLFTKIILMTATPYSSCLSQFYGLIHLIYPDLWKSNRAFFDRFIDEITIKDPRTHRVVRKEKVRYKNLKEFRETIEPFTYFYYPNIPLKHIEHHTRLKSYEDYDDLAKGIIKEEEKEKYGIKEGENESI